MVTLLGRSLNKIYLRMYLDDCSSLSNTKLAFKLPHLSSTNIFFLQEKVAQCKLPHLRERLHNPWMRSHAAPCHITASSALKPGHLHSWPCIFCSAESTASNYSPQFLGRAELFLCKSICWVTGTTSSILQIRDQDQLFHSSEAV